jgi:hypothetical protein
MGSPVYSDDQRQAIVFAMLDEGRTARAAVTAAAAGELGVPAFKIPESTARDIARQARRERGLSEVPTLERVASLVDRALMLAEDELERVENVEEVTAKDLSKMRESLRVVNEAARLSATHELLSRPAPQRGIEPPARKQPEPPSDLAARLLALEKQQPRPAHKAQRLERTLAAREAEATVNG